MHFSHAGYYLLKVLQFRACVTDDHHYPKVSISLGFIFFLYCPSVVWSMRTLDW